jgi:probable addiction module antidote protein
MPEKATKIKTHPYEPGMFLTDPESEAEYLTAGLEEDDGDGQTIAAVLEVLARKHGIVAGEGLVGMDYQSLLNSLTENGTVNLTKVLAVLKAMGLTLTAGLKPSDQAAE